MLNLDEKHDVLLWSLYYTHSSGLSARPHQNKTHASDPKLSSRRKKSSVFTLTLEGFQPFSLLDVFVVLPKC